MRAEIWDIDSTSWIPYKEYQSVEEAILDVPFTKYRIIQGKKVLLLVDEH